VLYKAKGENDSWFIEEIKSNKVMKDKMREKEAKDMCRNLNLGGGFDGLTPDFFFNRIIIKEYI
jgi:hypothetical protein